MVLWCSQIARVTTTTPQRSPERETLHYLRSDGVPRSGVKNNLCHRRMGTGGQSDCSARHNYWSTATCTGCAALLTAPRGLLVAAQTTSTRQQRSSALKMSIIKFGTRTSANYPAVRQNTAAVPCYICCHSLNTILVGKGALLNTNKTIILWD